MHVFIKLTRPPTTDTPAPACPPKRAFRAPDVLAEHGSHASSASPEAREGGTAQFLIDTAAIRNGHNPFNNNRIYLSNRYKTGVFCVPHHGAIRQSARRLRRLFSSVEPPAFACPPEPAFQGEGGSFQNSNRNTLGNRNRCNSPFIRDLIFSTRNKMRGVAGKKSALSASRALLRDEQFANLPDSALADLRASQGSSNVRPLTSNLCILLIATRANRNHLNSPDISANCHSNRNKRKGSRGPGEGPTGEMTGVAESGRRAAGSPRSIQHPASSVQLPESNRESSGNRNRRISCCITDLNFSNREGLGGSPTKNQPCLSKIKRKTRKTKMPG